MNKAKGIPQHKGRSGSPKRARIFVYGTLRKGSWNHGFLKGAKFISTAKTFPEYQMKVASYPWLLPARAGEGAEIVGEVWEVSPKTKELLDRLERGYACIPVNLQGFPEGEVLAYMATPETSAGQALASEWGRQLPFITDFIAFDAARQKARGY